MTDDHESVIADAINAVEDIRDPLEGLAEKTAADPGAPFSPETLEGLAALKKEDRASFEALRAQLKKAGCRVTALDEAVAEENGDMGGREPRASGAGWPGSSSRRRKAHQVPKPCNRR
jgi:hypothetical protein